MGLLPIALLLTQKLPLRLHGLHLVARQPRLRRVVLVVVLLRVTGRFFGRCGWLLSALRIPILQLLDCRLPGILNFLRLRRLVPIRIVIRSGSGVFRLLNYLLWLLLLLWSNWSCGGHGLLRLGWCW